MCRPPNQVNLPNIPGLAKHYEQSLVSPSSGIITGHDGTAVTNWLTNTVEFKKVLFTKPINIVTNDTETVIDGGITIHATKYSVIKFEDCKFAGTGGIDYAVSNIDSTSCITCITYDTGGQLIITRNGILEWVGSPRERLKQHLKARMAPAIIKSRALDYGANFNGIEPNEVAALQLLRNMVPHDMFKKYLKYGFVIVRGSSGVEYQIRRKEHIIYAWKDGKKIASLCVYLQDTSIPPTDEVVAKMLICECDEKDIWKRANVTWWTQERLIMVA